MKNNKGIRRNWAGNVLFSPDTLYYPATEQEIQQIVLRAANNRKKIRVIGTGHSFTKLCQTDQILMSLDDYQGLVSVDRKKCTVVALGGTKLKFLGELLYKEGLAMQNLGDIDAQSIAGTISTGTHGTGKKFGTISTQVIGIKLINGQGHIVYCSPDQNPELFKAAQVSLGALGIIVEVTLQCVPSYKLLIQNEKENIEHLIQTIEQRNLTNRNFEYYWFPYTQTAWTKSTNIAESGKADRDSIFNYLSELVLENYSYKMLCEIARWFPSMNKTISGISAQFVPTMKKLNWSHKVYATMRIVRFKEMEYNIPAETFTEVLKR